GGINGPHNGYHETITLFWIRVIDKFIKSQPGKLDFGELAEAFFRSQWSDSKLPFAYYSKEHLLSTEARAVWVEPDVRAFDF
ncbi:MAG: hypothetical protein AAF206_16795, partial [Bacteroidota bacterium]